jgi:predicted TIM-barrel fold metal-dependent hydrolase
MIIDCHTHVFSPRVKAKRDEYEHADPGFAFLYVRKEARLATTDELVSSMDEAGIDFSVITNISWQSTALCTESNDYIMESVARYPRRLAGFIAIPFHSPQAALAEISRCHHPGIKGIGELRPEPGMLRPDRLPALAPVMALAAERHLSLLLHTSEPVGHQYPGKGYLTPEVLYPFLSAYPENTIILAHWGGGLPFYALMPEVRKALSNVYFDTAASPFLYTPKIYQMVTELVGKERILFGSDWPLLPPKRLLNEIESLGLPEDIRTRLLSVNAQRLLGIAN